MFEFPYVADAEFAAVPVRWEREVVANQIYGNVSVVGLAGRVVQTAALGARDFGLTSKFEEASSGVEKLTESESVSRVLYKFIRIRCAVTLFAAVPFHFVDYDPAFPVVPVIDINIDRAVEMILPVEVTARK